MGRPVTQNAVSGVNEKKDLSKLIGDDDDEVPDDLLAGGVSGSEDGDDDDPGEDEEEEGDDTYEAKCDEAAEPADDDADGDATKFRMLARIAGGDSADLGAIKQRIQDDVTLLTSWRKSKG